MTNHPVKMGKRLKKFMGGKNPSDQKYMKRWSTSLIVTEMQTETISRYNLTPNTRMKIWMTDGTKCWWARREAGALQPAGASTDRYNCFRTLASPTKVGHRDTPWLSTVTVRWRAKGSLCARTPKDGYQNVYRNTIRYSPVPITDVNSASMASVLYTSFGTLTTICNRDWNLPLPK